MLFCFHEPRSLPIPVAARSKAWVCCRLPAGFAGSIPTGGMIVSVVCCHVEVSATGRSLVQRTPTECGVSECDPETSKTNRLSPTGTAKPLQKPYLILNIRKKLHFHYKNSTFHHTGGMSHDSYNFQDGRENIRQAPRGGRAGCSSPKW